MEIGKIIAKLRNKVGMSQRDLASTLGVSSGAVGMWETGKRQPDIDTIKVMASLFGVSVDYLLGLSKSSTGSNDCYNYFYENGDANWSIRKIAEKKEISYEEALEKTCIEKDRFDSIWFGSVQPVAEELIRFSRVLGVSIDYLLDNSQRERVTSDEEVVLRYYHNDEDNAMMLLESFCSLSKKGRAIILGKCLEMEQEESVAADSTERKASGK